MSSLKRDVGRLHCKRKFNKIEKNGTHQMRVDSLTTFRLHQVEGELPFFVDANVALWCAKRGTECWKWRSVRLARSS